MTGVVKWSGIITSSVEMSEADFGALSQSSFPPQDLGKPQGRKGHRKSLVQASMAESMKLKLMRAKALRDGQRERLDSRHRYILSYVSDSLKLETSAVEEYMLDGDQVHIVYMRECIHFSIIVKPV